MTKEKGKRILTENKLILQLYVSGMSPNSMLAIENIKQLCAEHLEDAFDLEIIDIYKNPELAAEQHIVFSPSLIKQMPLPKKTLIGTLSNSDKVARALGISFKN
jgi:circadian clock protein KaiB